MSRIAVRIARTELRRTLRTVLSDWTKMAIYVVLGLFFLGPVLVFGSLFLAEAGEELVAGEIGSSDLETVANALTGVAAVAGVGLTVLATGRTVTTVADIDEPGSLLISTSLRNVVMGLVLKESLIIMLWIAGPVLVLSGAFAWGATAPLVPLFALTTVGVLTVGALSVGFVVGICLRHLLTVYEPVAQYRTLVFVALGVAYFGSIATGWLNVITGLLFDVLGDSPLGWPGQLLLVGIPVIEPTLWEAVAGVAGAVGLTLVSLGIGVRLAEIHLLADPAKADGQEETVDSNDWVGSLLSGLASRSIRTVTVTAIRRTRRAPARIAYVAYPLLGAVGFIGDAIQSGEIPVFAAVLFGIYVVWAAGALFTLNLLGDHGPAMPAVLTATISGRAAVAGTVLAGIICMLPLAVVVPPVVGFVSPLDTVETALLTVGTVVGTLVSPVLAVGVGTLFPRFGEVRITSNRHAVMPSKSAFIVYSLAILFPIGAGVVLYFDSAPEAIAEILSGLIGLVPSISFTVPEMGVTVVAAGILLAGIVGPFLSVGYAVRQFNTYRPQ
ncbi:hypothetical protein ACFQJ7_09715 [Halovenus rubra]|uniref:ABC-2 type transport system permease protein n=2 Tax=Halovenus rubra TaxID=869890 RepID=A0ABD5X519_9EURY|nr:hypothetical protein [Halovenus rubra]